MRNGRLGEPKAWLPRSTSEVGVHARCGELTVKSSRQRADSPLPVQTLVSHDGTLIAARRQVVSTNGKLVSRCGMVILSERNDRLVERSSHLMQSDRPALRAERSGVMVGTIASRAEKARLRTPASAPSVAHRSPHAFGTLASTRGRVSSPVWP